MMGVAAGRGPTSGTVPATMAGGVAPPTVCVPEGVTHAGGMPAAARTRPPW